MSTTSNYRKHPAKKLVCLLLTLTLLLTLSAAAFAAGTHEISDGAFPLYANSMNTGMEMKLYFLDGVGDLPYMEVNDLVTLLRMFFASEFAISVEDAVVTVTRTNEAYSAACGPAEGRHEILRALRRRRGNPSGGLRH